MTCPFRYHDTMNCALGPIGPDKSKTSMVDSLQSNLLSLTLADARRKPFRFFDLPFELRSRILELVLVTDRTVDLNPENYRAAQKRLDVFLVSRRIHEEAYPAYYGGHTFRIFPTNARFFGDKTKPLLARLSTRYRAALVSLELRLGPGWSRPPKSWRVDERLGLVEMTAVRIVKVFVECDPSQDVFKGFRAGEGFYTGFSESLLGGVMDGLPALRRVEFDGWPSVMRSGVLMQTLINLAQRTEKKVLVISDLDSFKMRRKVYVATAKLLT